ncbi:MAG: GNAT family N-acetyltransferase [Oscillospiraceae bacterium]|nr:GNAT family N-acetyltransferase [Oscillospiraceae bacterium]
MTICSHPEASETDSLRQLVFRCFPEDSEEFLSSVFENVYTPEEALVLRTDGIISAAVLLPRFRLSDGSTFGYVYCLCTSPDFRGGGLMRRLLTEAEDFCYSRGDSFVALVPANEKLALTYSKMGYSPVTCATIGKNASRFAFSCRAGEEDIPLLNELYENRFAASPHIIRTPKLWKTLMKLYSADGGGIFIHKGGYLFAESRHEGFIIREAAGTDIPEGIGYQLPASNGVPVVFAKGYSGSAPMLNLLFD